MPPHLPYGLSLVFVRFLFPLPSFRHTQTTAAAAADASPSDEISPPLDAILFMLYEHSWFICGRKVSSCGSAPAVDPSAPSSSIGSFGSERCHLSALCGDMRLD